MNVYFAFDRDLNPARLALEPRNPRPSSSCVADSCAINHAMWLARRRRSTNKKKLRQIQTSRRQRPTKFRIVQQLDSFKSVKNGQRNVLPNSLRILRFSNCFNQPINYLPNSVSSIVFLEKPCFMLMKLETSWYERMPRKEIFI